MNKKLKINKYAVKFIPKLDELNGYKIVIYSPVNNKYYISNKDLYFILKLILEHSPTYTELIDQLGLDLSNIEILNDLIKKKIVLDNYS